MCTPARWSPTPVYGSGGSDREIVESDSRRPLSAYARSKGAGEDRLEELANDEFHCTSIRAATVYGYSSRIRYDLVLNELTLMAVTTGEARLNSSGTAWRPFIHINDLCSAYATVIEAGPTTAKSRVFNVGSALSTCPVVNAIEMICDATGARLIRLPTAQDDARNYRVNFDLFSHVYPSWNPVTLESGLQTLVDLLRVNAVAHDAISNPRFRRLPQLLRLIDEGFLYPDLRWRPLAQIDTTPAKEQNVN